MWLSVLNTDGKAVSWSSLHRISWIQLNLGLGIVAFPKGLVQCTHNSLLAFTLFLFFSLQEGIKMVFYQPLKNLRMKIRQPLMFFANEVSLLLFSPKYFAEKERKSQRQNFATKLRKSVIFDKR